MCLALNLIECWFNSLSLIQFGSVQFSSVQIKISKCRLPSSLVCVVCVCIHSLTLSQPALTHSLTHIHSLISISISVSLSLPPFGSFLSFHLVIEPKQQMTGIFLNGACKINKGTSKNNSCNCNIPSDTRTETIHWVRDARSATLKSVCPLAMRVWQKSNQRLGPGFVHFCALCYCDDDSGMIHRPTHAFLLYQFGVLNYI